MDRTTRHPGFLLVIGCLGMTAFDAAAGQPVRIELMGEVTYSDFFTVLPGDPITFSLTVDGQAADENPAPGEFASTAPGTFSARIETGFPVSGEFTGDIVGISADAATGDWNGDFFDPLVTTEIVIALHGSGLGPDQILPNHANFTSGTGEFEVVSGPYLGARTDVVFQSVEIVPIGTQVPAIGSTGRSGVALLLLVLAATPAGVRRR